MRTTNVAYESESVVESLDYFPYGGPRVDTKTNYGGVRNKYAGTVYDALSGLNYMQARYQNSSRGQFISEDPVFLGDPSQQNLKDPQSLNSYSYANDNPIAKSDPTGRLVGIDDLAEIGLVELAIPIVRGAIVTGLVNTDFQIGSNIYQNAVQKGRLGYDASPSSLGSAFGQGALFGATAETGAAFLTPFAKMALTAKNAKLVSQSVSAAGVAAGADIYSGDTDPSQLISDASVAGFSTYGGARFVGVPRGSDVKSFSSPMFFGGANMSNAARSGIASQSIQNFSIAALSTVVAGLKSIVSSLQAQRSGTK
jgi:RHS repeat-associated protein